MLWPVVEGMVRTMVENEESYLFEGVQLHPQDVAELCWQMPGRIRTCFVGYADADPQAKFQEIRRHGGGPDDWLSGLDDVATKAEVNRLIAQSRLIRAECARMGLRYFEVGMAWERRIEEVVAYLIDPE